MKIQTKYRLNFLLVENFHEVECTEGSLKCLCMIIGEGEGGWPCDDISKQVFLQSEIVFKLLPVVLLKIICFLSQFFH